MVVGAGGNGDGRAAKRDMLLEAAIELFGENGFWNTSTASVAKHAGGGDGHSVQLFPH